MPNGFRSATLVIIRFESKAPVAQLDRASGYEPEGREFESLRAHHLNRYKLDLWRQYGIVALLDKMYGSLVH